MVELYVHDHPRRVASEPVVMPSGLAVDARAQAALSFLLPYKPCTFEMPDLLSAADAADRAAGVVRVDTTDPAVVERVARGLALFRGESWDLLDIDAWNSYRRAARAVLAALRETS